MFVMGVGSSCSCKRHREYDSSPQLLERSPLKADNDDSAESQHEKNIEHLHARYRVVALRGKEVSTVVLQQHSSCESERSVRSTKKRRGSIPLSTLRGISIAAKDAPHLARINHFACLQSKRSGKIFVLGGINVTGAQPHHHELQIINTKSSAFIVIFHMKMHLFVVADVVSSMDLSCWRCTAPV